MIPLPFSLFSIMLMQILAPPSTLTPTVPFVLPSTDQIHNWLFPPKIIFDIAKNDLPHQQKSLPYSQTNSSDQKWQGTPHNQNQTLKTPNASPSPLQSLLELPRSTQPAQKFAPIPNYVPSSYVVVTTHVKVLYKDKIVYVPKYEYVPYPQIKVVEKPIYVAVPIVPQPFANNHHDDNSRNQTKPTDNSDVNGKNRGSGTDIAGNPTLAQMIDWLLPLISAMAVLVGFKNRLSEMMIRVRRK